MLVGFGEAIFETRSRLTSVPLVLPLSAFWAFCQCSYAPQAPWLPVAASSAPVSVSWLSCCVTDVLVWLGCCCPSLVSTSSHCWSFWWPCCMLGLSFCCCQCEGLPWMTRGLLKDNESPGRALFIAVSQDCWAPSRPLSVVVASGSVT